MIAHVAGIPVEEAIVAVGPALVLMVGAAAATVRARFHRR